jgi:hypothetical protein
VIRVKKPPLVKGKFPKASETADRRTAEGMGGGQQPSVIVHPSAPLPSPSNAGVVRVYAKEAGGAKYKGKLQVVVATIKATGDFLANSTGAIDGMSDGEEALVLNVGEGKAHALPLPCYAVYESIGKADDGRRIVAIQAEAAGTLRYVNLTEEGIGTDGNETTAPSYTYTVKLINGEQVLTGASPQCGRSVGSFTPALHGWGFFTPEGNFILTNAHEVEGAEPCPTPP